MEHFKELKIFEKEMLLIYHCQLTPKPATKVFFLIVTLNYENYLVYGFV